MNFIRRRLSDLLYSSNSYNYHKVALNQLDTFAISRQKPNITLNLVDTFQGLIVKIRNTCYNPFISYQFDSSNHSLLIKTLNNSYAVVYRNYNQFSQDDLIKYLFNVSEKYEGCIVYLISNADTEQLSNIASYFPDIRFDDNLCDKLCNEIKKEKILEDKSKTIYLVSQIFESYCSTNTMWITYYMFIWFLSMFNCVIYNCNKQFEAWDDRFESEFVIDKERKRFRQCKSMVQFYNTECEGKNIYSKHVKGYFDKFDTYDDKIVIIHDPYNGSILGSNNHTGKFCNIPVMQCLYFSKSYCQEYNVLSFIQKVKFILHSNIMMVAYLLMFMIDV